MNRRHALGWAGAGIAVALSVGVAFAITSRASNSYEVVVPNLSRDELGPTAVRGSHLPTGWPQTLEVGISDLPTGVSNAGAAGFGFRYQYLAGGVNTGNGWRGWSPDGSFVSNYIEEARSQGVTPVFSYYMIRQSLPGAEMSEADGIAANLESGVTMDAYLDDLVTFFRRAGTTDLPVVFHFEPDLWGYVQQRAQDHDASTVRVAIGDSDNPFAVGKPETAAGLANSILAMRDALAPNVVVAYHLSIWGTGEDPTYSNPSDTRIEALATKSVHFYDSLGTTFDLIFMEFSDRDSAFKQYINGDGGASWWDADDFRWHRMFISRVSETTGLGVVLWQIPQGNSVMRAMNNTWNHYQDNRVEWLFGNVGLENLRDYVEAGVIGLLFGRGADGATCACDGNGDGVTNPAPINGNTRPSLSADDDGGYFIERISAYFATGKLELR